MQGPKDEEAVKAFGWREQCGRGMEAEVQSGLVVAARLRVEGTEGGYTVAEPWQRRSGRTLGAAECQAKKGTLQAKHWIMSLGLHPNPGSVLTGFHSLGLGLWNFL